GAYFWMHLREQGRGVGALAARLLGYAVLVRAGITALMIVATTQRLGSHYDLSGFTRVTVPVTGAVQTFEPGSWQQIAFLGAVPQLTFSVATTVLMGLLGAGLYSVAGSIHRPQPSPLVRPRFDWKPPPAPASQDR
ncbi:MAG TPA: hypothetical protein VIZ31_04145, partial [Vicinamibacteria bacterium]